jgi:hypothetical protein
LIRALTGIGILAGLATGCTSAPPPAPPPSPAAELPDTVLQYVLETTPSGEAVAWRIATTGTAGTVTPLRTFRTAEGYCRTYAVAMTPPSDSTLEATACRDAAGIWRPPTEA